MSDNFSTSILMGAGFSAPIGYPIGNRLNELLLECKGTEFGFHTNGVLCVDQRTGGRPDFGYKTSYDVEFDFCRELIHHYNKNISQFDYEEFYDYLLDVAKTDKSIEPMAKPFLGAYHKSIPDLIGKLKNIYNQMVEFYLKDREGKTWYDDEVFVTKPYFPGYTGILNCLEHWGTQGTVNIHTLNHDLFMERLSHTDWINSEFSDGFEEQGSPYFGNLESNNRSYNVRLQYYTGKYDKVFRLYKLHGSRDYGIYYGSDGPRMTPEVYVKTRFGVGFGEFLKEIQDGEGNPTYEDCWVNYHADFLTGTTSKIERYREPLLYKKLFEHFRNNLREADQLIIIGYGSKDTEINRMIVDHFDFKNKPSFIIDPYPSKAVDDLRNELGAKLIKSQLENVTI